MNGSAHISDLTFEFVNGAGWAMVRSHFDVKSFGVNAYVAPEPGIDVIGEHDELGDDSGKHEELYFVSDGHATFTLLARHPDPTATIAAGSLVAPMPGNVLRVLVAPGDAVTAAQPLVVVEAMKMEHQVVAPADGTVEAVHVVPGDQVQTGQLLLQVEDA